MKSFIFMFLYNSYFRKSFILFILLSVAYCRTSNVESQLGKPDIVFFDYNGTLYDDKTMLNKGCKKYCKWKTYEDKKMFDKLSVGKKYDFLSTKLSNDILNQIYDYLVAQPFKIVNGADILLKELQRQNIVSYVITGTDGKKVRNWLTNAKLSQYFHGIYGANDFGDLQKPNKDFAEKIKEVVGLKQHQCWMIGDSEQDIIMAKNLGCKCFIIDNFEEIKQNYANLIDENVLLMTYNEILNLIKNIHKYNY